MVFFTGKRAQRYNVDTKLTTRDLTSSTVQQYQDKMAFMRKFITSQPFLWGCLCVGLIRHVIKNMRPFYTYSYPLYTSKYLIWQFFIVPVC